MGSLGAGRVSHRSALGVSLEMVARWPGSDGAGKVFK